MRGGENESVSQVLGKESFLNAYRVDNSELLKRQQLNKERKAATPDETSVTVKSAMHSRNACKKLKCPKCNWHYKYRETLDIHMREKHQTDSSRADQVCQYCVENSQHPRLGRGEQYKCGYKPYRCDICDYSTTTKGKENFVFCQGQVAVKRSIFAANNFQNLTSKNS